jgi:nucleoside-diphosphate-sugar epimerase
MEDEMASTALVVGASGIVGRATAEELLKRGGTVFGLSRRPESEIVGLRPVAADLLDPSSLKTALEGVAPSHGYISTWSRQANEAETIKVNSAMARNVLDAPAARHRRVGLRPVRQDAGGSPDPLIRAERHPPAAPAAGGQCSAA